MNKKLCIVVPYRDREAHLQEFLPWMEKTLTDQNIDYKILIVEQTFSKPFNRAKLLNVGFAHTDGSFDYYCFHDVDMLPVKSDYTYCPNPTHLATQAEQFNWELPYEGYFGGVTIFDRESFIRINGYSNEYWGWGAEDDDVFHRCKSTYTTMSRKPCRYKSLAHGRTHDTKQYESNIDRLKAFHQSYTIIDGEIIFNEGLSTLEYSVISSNELTVNYERITVEI
jgi:predicted glycosyltransferase involved in capsule biosynthesis